MHHTFITYHPQLRRRELLVEVHPGCPGAGEEALHALKRRMHDRHVHAGMLVTPTATYALHDTSLHLEFCADSCQVREVSTDVLFSRIALTPEARLEMRVKEWLGSVATTGWSRIIPEEAWTAIGTILGYLPTLFSKTTERWHFCSSLDMETYDCLLGEGD